uniref:RING-type domain-containing protein n=1 Tax=Caenorhabditis japonica TaxID=281687 RepID=A0A8R1ER07_CAEJA
MAFWAAGNLFGYLVLLIYLIYGVLAVPITLFIRYILLKLHFGSDDDIRLNELSRAIYLFGMLTFFPVHLVWLFVIYRRNRGKPLFTPKWKISDNLTEDDFQCSICYDLLVEPHTLLCHHSFCKKCVNQAMRLNRRCPSCTQWTIFPAADVELKKRLLLWIKEQGREEEYAEVVELKKSVSYRKPNAFVYLCNMFTPFYDVPDHQHPPIRLRPLRSAVVEPIRDPEPVVVEVIDEFDSFAVDDTIEPSNNNDV